MEIRPEAACDTDAIEAVTRAAFASAPHGSGTEAEIVDALRRAGALALSLVAVEDGAVVGHAAFSPVTIDGAKSGWLGLGPVSVRPDRQANGIGSRLVREGLRRIAASGADGCVVFGDPAFYRRFGFESATGLRFADAPAEYFMARAFGRPVPAGRVRYHAGFGAG